VATRAGERKKQIKNVQKMLWNRMDELGYRDVMTFLRASGLEDKISFETVRRSLNDEKKPPSPISVGVIMQRLGFGNDEIRNTMIGLGDSYMHLLVSPGERQAELWQEGIGEALVKLADVNLNYIKAVSEHVRLLAEIAGVDVDDELSKVVLNPKQPSSDISTSPVDSQTAKSEPDEENEKAETVKTKKLRHVLVN